MRLRTRTLRPGTRLYHGTAGDFDERSERLIPPAWLSEVAAVARNFADWRGKTNVRLIEYRVTEPIRLVVLPDKETMWEIGEEFGVDSGDVEELADWVSRQGYDGWIVPDNYPVEGGSDIMIWAVDRLRHVSTTPVTESGSYGMAQQRIDEIAGGSDWPGGPTPPVNPSAGRMKWSPDKPQTVRLGKPDRFNLPEPRPKPTVRYLGRQDLDALLDRIKAEENQPPHKRNEARIAELKRQAQAMMGEMESVWVQSSADKLLPRLDEAQGV